ncbi:MAG: hypothetical protein ACO3NW_04725 [Kiritimatiellia bacterium]
MKQGFKTLSPEEEIEFMRQELKLEQPIQLVDRIVGHFHILQTRAGFMLSLVTICLTISGFSGHRIAAAGRLPATLLALGLLLAVLSAGILFAGPLHLRWATRHACPGGLDATLIEMIKLRNSRTRLYFLAGGVLLAGLTAYMSSVILFIFITGWMA